MNSNPLKDPAAWTHEPITAWRLFETPRTAMGTGYWLTSLSERSQHWSGQSMPPAYCNREKAQYIGGDEIPTHERYDDSPYPGCLCGYWSIKPALLPEFKMWDEIAWHPAGVLLIGAAAWVEQWGVVDEYQHGYRSSHIRITAFIDMADEAVEHLEYTQTEGWGGRPVSQRYRNRIGGLAEYLNVPVVGFDAPA